jgi:hypothetical protein
MAYRGGRRTLVAAVTVAVLAAGAAVAADETAVSGADVTRLFGELLQDPANVELNLRFARVAEQRGDLEAAIGALERLLVNRPDLPNVRLKIGQLYQRLGSDAMARAYLEPLAAASETPPDLRDAARQDLRRASERPSPHHFSMTLFTGAQWQTNPGTAPGSSVFLLSGVPTQLSSAVSKRSDSDIFGQASATYAYDLGTPYHDAIVVDGLAYGSSFRRLHTLDTVFGNVTAGPRFSTERIGISGGGVRPYALTSGIRLGGAPYDYAYGGGLDYDQKLGRSLPSLDVDYEARQVNYHTTNNFPTARLLNGRLDHYGLSLTQALGPAALVEIGAIYNRQNTRLSGYSNDDLAIAATLSFGYRAGPLPFGYPCVTSISVARHYVDYDAPDPSVSPTIKRADHRWQISIGESVPITEHFSVAAVLYRDINSSNIGNYSYGNTSFLVGPQFSF